MAYLAQLSKALLAVVTRARISALTFCVFSFYTIANESLELISIQDENSENAAVPAQRIVALAPHLVEMLFEVGAGDRIVATVDYADHPEAAKSIPRIGGHYGVNIEALVGLKPDLVLFWQGGNKAQDLEKIQQLGLNVVTTTANSIEQVASDLIKLGALTGQQAKAQQRAKHFTERLSAIRLQYQDKTSVPVFYQLWSSPLMTINQDSWINQLISSCNAQNVFATSSVKTPQVSIENVMLAKPEIIVVPDAGSPYPQDIGIWQQWSQIPAVAKQQIIHVNGDVMHRFSSNMLDGLSDMCRQIDSVRH
ncbi:cobalamin-binding protein [Colwellia sp. MEBiC06753]